MVKKKRHLPLGERIQRLRRDSGLSLKAVANETGFSEDFLKEVEAGDSMPPVGALLKISRALGVDSGLVLQTDWFPDEDFDLKTFASPDRQEIFLKGAFERENIFIHFHK